MVNTASNREKYIWNMLGSLSSAVSSFILSISVNRILGAEDGGFFAFAYANAQQMITIGQFEVRPYQATDINEKYKLEEMRVCQATEKLKLLEENPELDANGILLVGKSGSILAYNGENNYSYISDERELYSNNGEVGFFLSEAEQNQRALKASIERYKRMTELHAPKVILEDMESGIAKRNIKRKTMKIGNKFTPQDIEDATEEITLEGMNKILEELSEPLQTRKESLEKGIGYDE